MIAFASSLDQAGPLDARRHRRGAAARGAWSAPTRATRRRSALPERRSRCRRAQRLRRHRASACPEELSGEGIEPGVRARFDATLDAGARSSARRSCDVALPHAPHALAAYYLIAPAEASLEPRALRRRALRPARRRRRPARRCTRARARDGLRRRGQAAHHARHLRAVARATTTPTTGRRRRCARRSPRTSRTPSSASTSSSRRRRPSVAFELGAKTDDPLAMYLNDFFTVPMPLAGIPAISIPVRPERGPAGGLPDRRPGVQREPRSSTPAHALEQALGFDGTAGRPRDERADVEYEAVIGLEIHVQLRDPRRRCSAAASCRFGEPPNTRTCPVCLGLPGALPVSTREAIELRR